MTPNTRLHAPHHTQHPRPPPRPPPRLGGKETRRWNSPKEEPQTRMGGFSNAPRCPAFLTFRDSPALSRQESDGYTPYALPLLPQRRPPIPPSSIPPRILRPRQAARRWASALHAPAPLRPAHTPWPDTHIQDKPGVLLSKETKKWEGGDQRGRLPAYATPQEGAAIAEAVPKHNSQTRSGPGGLGGCLPDRRRTGLSARGWMGCRPCFPSWHQIFFSDSSAPRCR